MSDFGKNNGPRIFNGQTKQDQLEILEKKKNRRVHEIHRVRRNRIFVIFGLLIGLLLFQILTVKFRTTQINNDVNASKIQYKRAADENIELKQRVEKLNDDTYIGKLIRYKYYYSKPGETVYNLPIHEFEVKEKNE